MRDIQMRNSNPAITSRDVCDCFACSSPGREENFDLAAKPGSIFFFPVMCFPLLIFIQHSMLSVSHSVPKGGLTSLLVNGESVVN